MPLNPSHSLSLIGLHLLPNSVSMSTGSVFAGWVMHKTGRYKTLNAIFGIFPFVATIFISLMHEGMGPVQSWLSIVSCPPIAHRTPSSSSS